VGNSRCRSPFSPSNILAAGASFLPAVCPSPGGSSAVRSPPLFHRLIFGWQALESGMPALQGAQIQRTCFEAPHPRAVGKPTETSPLVAEQKPCLCYPGVVHVLHYSQRVRMRPMSGVVRPAQNLSSHLLCGTAGGRWGMSPCWRKPRGGYPHMLHRKCAHMATLVAIAHHCR